MLRHAGAADAAARGQVHIISVNAVRDAVGERWTRHDPLVEDFVIRSFRRGGREDDFIVRVNETDFMLIQPSREPMGALSRASQLMRETLSYFLGAVKSENINVSIVDRLSDDGIEATRLSEADLEAAAAQRGRDMSHSIDGSPPWERFGVARAAGKVVSIRRPGGADIQAVFYLEPIWNVTQGAVVSFVARTIAVQTGSNGEFEAIDRRDLTPRTHTVIACKRLQFVREIVEAGHEGPRVAIHMPLSINGLSFTGTRTEILSELKKVSAIWRERLFIELTDTPPAIPQARLAEIVGQLRPFCRGVHIRVDPGNGDVVQWNRCGAVGVIYTALSSQPERETLARLDRMITGAAQIGMGASLYGVNTRSLALAAWAAGATHLSGDCIGGRFGQDIVARRFTMDDLYATEAASLAGVID
ncbi:hypothetical protein AB4Y66_12985 [Brevundimonas sp. M-11_2]